MKSAIITSTTNTWINLIPIVDYTKRAIEVFGLIRESIKSIWVSGKFCNTGRKWVTNMRLLLIWKNFKKQVRSHSASLMEILKCKFLVQFWREEPLVAAIMTNVTTTMKILKGCFGWNLKQVNKNTGEINCKIWGPCKVFTIFYPSPCYNNCIYWLNTRTGKQRPKSFPYVVRIRKY